MRCVLCFKTHPPDRSCLSGVVVVCGGRDYADRATVFSTLDKLTQRVQITTIRHGACGWDGARPGSVDQLRGADRLAHLWADRNRIALDPVPAWWSTFGRAAGPIRNQSMLDRGGVCCVVAFPGGHGTANMITLAERAGLPVWRVVPPSRVAA